MAKSYLQDEFLRVVAKCHRATVDRVVKQVSDLRLPDDVMAQVEQIISSEIRGLFHGSLVVLDGGSSLADQGLIRVVDDEGVPFASNLHEICLSYFDETEQDSTP